MTILFLPNFTKIRLGKCKCLLETLHRRSTCDFEFHSHSQCHCSSASNSHPCDASRIIRPEMQLLVLQNRIARYNSAFWNLSFDLWDRLVLEQPQKKHWNIIFRGKFIVFWYANLPYRQISHFPWKIGPSWQVC